MKLPSVHPVTVWGRTSIAALNSRKARQQQCHMCGSAVRQGKWRWWVGAWGTRQWLQISRQFAQLVRSELKFKDWPSSSIQFGSVSTSHSPSSNAKNCHWKCGIRVSDRFSVRYEQFKVGKRWFAFYRGWEVSTDWPMEKGRWAFSPVSSPAWHLLLAGLCTEWVALECSFDKWCARRKSTLLQQDLWWSHRHHLVLSSNSCKCCHVIGFSVVISTKTDLDLDFEVLCWYTRIGLCFSISICRYRKNNERAKALLTSLGHWISLAQFRGWLLLVSARSLAPTSLLSQPAILHQHLSTCWSVNQLFGKGFRCKNVKIFFTPFGIVRCQGTEATCRNIDPLFYLLDICTKKTWLFCHCVTFKFS